MINSRTYSAFVPEIGIKAAKINYLYDKIRQETIKTQMQQNRISSIVEVLEETEKKQETLTLRDTRLTTRALGELTEVLRNNPNFCKNELDLLPENVKELTASYVERLLTEDSLNSQKLKILYKELQKQSQYLLAQENNTNRLKNSLGALQQASQQVSFGGAKMINERLESIERIRRTGNRSAESFLQQESKSIGLLFAVTSPVPLKTGGNFGILQQYLNNLGDSLIKDWEKKADPIEVSAFKNPVFNKAANLYFEKVCLPSYLAYFAE